MVGDRGYVHYTLCSQYYWLLPLTELCLPLGSFSLQNVIKCCNIFQSHLWRHSGLVVSALAFGLSSAGSSPDQGHCVVFLSETLNSHRAFLHQAYKWVAVNLRLRGYPVMD